MKRNQFSDSITKYSTVPQAQDRYKLSRYSITKFAVENNAIVKIGKSVRIDCEKLDQILSSGNK